MATEGVLVKGAAMITVNGTYNHEQPSGEGDVWVSADKTTALRHVKQVSHYAVEGIDDTTLYTPEMEAKHKQYVVLDLETGEYYPINLQIGDDNSVNPTTIYDQLGMNTIHTFEEEEPRALTEQEMEYGRSGARIYYWKNGEDDYTALTETDLESTTTENLVYRKIRLLYTAENMNHWVISGVTVNETGLVYGTEYYYAFDDSTDPKPYNHLSWIYVADGTGTADQNMTVEYWDQSTITVTTVTTTDPDGSTRTVTTYKNSVTGDVYRDTNIVRMKTRYETKEITRYDFLNLMLGKVYRFQFVSEFAQLGWTPGRYVVEGAGIYKVDAIMSYYDMMNSRIDLYTNLYEPCNVPVSVYKQDVARLQDAMIYRLVDPTDPTLFYFMPQPFIVGQPDGSVLPYNRVSVTLDLDVQPTQETVDKMAREALDKGDKLNVADTAMFDLKEMEATIKQVLAAKYGLVSKVGASTTLYKTYDQVWLADDEFRRICRRRQAVMKTSNVDFKTLFGLDENNRLYLENERLRARVEAQDQRIQQLIRTLTDN